MFQEIVGWTTLLSAIFFSLPYCIPAFRNRLNQPQQSVFGVQVITDYRQKEIDAVDRTVSQLVCTAFQAVIVFWGFMNVFGFVKSVGIESYESLDYAIIGFYAADMIYMWAKPFGKTQQMFFVHHALTILVISYIQFIQFQYSTTLTYIYILLEFSSASINVVNVYRYCYPLSKSIVPLSFYNLIIYFVTRVVLFPINVGWTVYAVVASGQSAEKSLYYFPLGFGILLYCVCVYWFFGMVAKHRALKQKMLL